MNGKSSGVKYHVYFSITATHFMIDNIQIVRKFFDRIFHVRDSHLISIWWLHTETNNRIFRNGGRRNTPFIAPDNGARSLFALFTPENTKSTRSKRAYESAETAFASQKSTGENANEQTPNVISHSCLQDSLFPRLSYPKHYRSDVNGNYWCLLTVVKSTVWRVTPA